MAERTDDMQMLPVRINVNGENWQGAIPAQETLLEFIRVRLRAYRARSAPANLRFAARAPYWSMSNRSAPAIIWHAKRTESRC